MRPHHPPGQAPLVSEEPPVLSDAGQCPFGAVAIGDLVTEDRADAELCEGVGDDVERAVDEVGRRMVVNDRGRASQERVEPAAKGRSPDRSFVEGTVEPPPHPLEDLGEVPGRGQPVRHAPGQSRVQVVVGAHVAGHDERTGAVAARHPAWRIT